MSRLAIRLTLAAVGSGLTITAAATAAPQPPGVGAASAANHRGVLSAKKHKHKKKKKAPRKSKHASGPSMSVIGFGINRLYVPAGEKVTSSAKCDEMVGATSGIPIGPPQNIYLIVYVKGENIPSDAPLRFKDELPAGDDELEETELSSSAPWGNALAKGSFPFGGPPKKQEGLFHALILSTSDEGAGTYEGPSAEEFDGVYSYTLSVEVGQQTLTSTAKVTIECPMLR